MGAEVLQLFVQSNRQWRLPDRDDEVYAAYRRAADDSAVVASTLCRAPYLVNVISPDPATAARSRISLAANLRAATLLGARGLVLHPGSHRQVGADDALGRVAVEVVDALDLVAAQLGEVCDVLLENTAGSGGTIGRSFAELAAIVDAARGDARIGVCLDTQHLWAAGIEFATVAQADALVNEFAAVLGLGRLRCIHLNDSKVPFGAGRDRHQNLGQGTIGSKPLRALLGQPDLQDVPAVLEVPGVEGKGPGAADLAVARRLHAQGLSVRKRLRHQAR
jgi:deoxyribonuclease-4